MEMQNTRTTSDQSLIDIRSDLLYGATITAVWEDKLQKSFLQHGFCVTGIVVQ